MIRDSSVENLNVPSAASASVEVANLTDQPHRSADLLVRPKLRISDILAIKDGTLFTISQDASIDEAISHIVKQSVSCCLTLDGNGEVSGIFTARDILRFIHNTNNNNGSKHRGGQNSKMTANEMLSPPISEITVKKEKLVYCSPDDTVRQCREIMFQLRIRNLPVLSKNELLGIVSIQDLADSAFSLQDTGGKKGFIHNVTGRKGNSNI
jgi:CBS domain-containing protein